MQQFKLMLLVFAILAAATTILAEEEMFDTATAAVHLEKGIVYLKTKSFDAAVAELEEAVSIYPNAENYYYLGYAYYMKGKSGDSESRRSSIESFERAYELDPQFTPNRLKQEMEATAPLDAETIQNPAPQPDSGKKETADEEPSGQSEAGKEQAL